MPHRIRLLSAVIAGLLLLTACGGNESVAPVTEQVPAATTEAAVTPAPFVYEADRFADIRILRYQIPGFDQLSLQEKKLLYFLSQAGMSGRDIFYDQNYRYNLRIRHLLEQIVQH